MAGVYLGESGHVELRRHGENVPISGVLQPDDVNTTRRRFSFDFDPSALISGDRIEITRLGGGDLELVAGHNFPDGRWYCHVDDAGGVRLYDTFRTAINGEEHDALELMHPAAVQQIEVQAVNRSYRCVAGVREWSLSTNRDAADLTVLGEEHRRFYTNGLMSGQGTLRCFWNYEQWVCDGESANVELPHYLAQLVLRCQLGSEFLGQFYIKNRGAQPASGQLNRGAERDLIWWEAECVATNVGMSFAPSTPVETTIEFITTGPVRLKMGTPTGYLLQESGDYILQEDGSRLQLEED
jgi:hypothetical protein